MIIIIIRETNDCLNISSVTLKRYSSLALKHVLSAISCSAFLRLVSCWKKVWSCGFKSFSFPAGKQNFRFLSIVCVCVCVCVFGFHWSIVSDILPFKDFRNDSFNCSVSKYEWRMIEWTKSDAIVCNFQLVKFYYLETVCLD